MLLQNVFKSLVTGVTPATDNLWTEIQTHYSDDNRHYHNLLHLENMYNEILQCSYLLSDKDSILFALFYHDIIYDATAKDNEEKSAALAVKRLRQINYPEIKITLCYEAILATKKHDIHNNRDINLFTDADLSILGSEPEIYRQYYKNIRKEYSIYPDFLYKPGRNKVLQQFLKMDYIFKTEYFRNRYETAARDNIYTELENL